MTLFDPDTNLLQAVVPGVFFLAVAGLIPCLLDRWFDRIPLRVRVFHLLLVLVLFGQSLFLGWVQLPLEVLRASPPFDRLAAAPAPGMVLQSDLVEDLLPYSAASRRALRQMTWPLLNPIVGAGEPLLANPQAQTFHPLHLLTLPLPLERAAGVLASLKVLLALTFFYLFIARLGLRSQAALAGSIAFAFSGFFMMWLGWPHTHSATALAILLYSLLGLAQKPSLRFEALLTLGTVWALLGGHPQTIVMVAVIAATFGLSLARGNHPLRFLSRVGGSLLCALLLSLPVVLPSALWVGETTRSEITRAVAESRPGPLRVLENVASAEVSPSREDLVLRLHTRFGMAAAPLAFGAAEHSAYWGYQNPIEDGALWPGSLGLLALIAALLATTAHGFDRLLGRRRAPGEVKNGQGFGLALALVSLVLSLQLPGLHELLSDLPILGRAFSNPSRFALGFVAGCALLFAVLVDRTYDHGIGRAWVLPGGLLAAAAVVWAHLVHSPALVGNVLSQLRFETLMLQLATLVAVVAVLALRPRGAGMLLAALAAVELLSVHARFHQPMPSRLYFPQTAGIEFLQDNLDPLGAQPHTLASYRMIATGNVLRANFPVIYGVADWRSANPMQSARTARLDRELRESGAAAVFKVPNSPLYDLFGIRYVVRKRWQRLPLERVVHEGIAVFERPSALPVAWFPDQIQPVPADRVVAQTLEVTDFSATAVVPEDDIDSELGVADPSDEVELLQVTDSGLSLTIRTTNTRALATRIRKDAGWRALIDGQRADLLEVNSAFVGVVAPPGTHRLDLVYRPAGFLAGCLFAALGFALFLLRAATASGAHKVR